MGQSSCSYTSGIETSGRCPCKTEGGDDKSCNLDAKYYTNERCTLAETLVTKGTPGGPLEVQPPTFEFKRIGQQTPFPGATNLITVTLATNIAIETKLEARLTLEGLEGTAALPWPGVTDGAAVANLPITSQRITDTGPVEVSGLFGLTGTWDGKESKLVLALGRNLDREQNYSFAFNVKNSLYCGNLARGCGRGAATKFSLQAYKGSCRRERENFECPSPECGDLSDCTSRVVFAESDLISAPGDAAPLLLDAPAFLVKSIQSDDISLPGEWYSVAVSLSFNVALRAPSRVVLSGLVGTVDLQFTDVAGSGEVEEGEDGEDDDVTVRSVFVEDDKNFNASQGILALPLQNDIAVNPGQVYEIDFLLKLSTFAQDAPEVYVSTESGTITLDSTAMHGSVLKIDPPAFLEARTSQSTPHPGALNVVTISLKPNVEFTEEEVQVTIAGMFGAQNATVMRPVGARHSWHQASSTLVLTVDGNVGKVKAGTRVVIEVQVRNNFAPQPPPVLQVRGAGRHHFWLYGNSNALVCTCERVSSEICAALSLSDCLSSRYRYTSSLLQSFPSVTEKDRQL